MASAGIALGGRIDWRRWVGGWTLGTLVIAAVVILPVAAVVGLAFTPSDDIWSHLAATVLPLYIGTTLELMIGVGIGTLVVGVGTAWLVTMCRFPGRKLFEWALLLPMAVPAYVIAYIYTDILEYAGPVQGSLRDMFAWSTKSDYWFPEIRSMGGAVSMMTLVLYPYVYLLSRAAFLEQSVCVLEASRVLGRGPWRSFFSVALPLARPGIVIGVSLVLMETLNDFGTVDFFAVPTFTLGIFDVWQNMNSISGAAQLAALLLVFVFLLVLAERFSRRKQRFHHTTTKYRSIPGHPMGTGLTALAVAACALPVLLGFVVPAATLAGYAVRHFDDAATGAVLGHAANSVGLSALAATLAVLVAIFMAYGVRLHGGGLLKVLARIAAMGYAVPGSVLAVGVIIVLAGFDNALDRLLRAQFGVSVGLLLSGSIVAVTFGYLVRFLALSFGTVEASLAKVTPNMEGAARSLGLGAGKTLLRVHVPLMRASVLTAAMLVFVDCMKELPMTVILRPFDFQTLATFVHQYASDEQLGEASVAALSIVGAGVLPVILLSAAIARSRPGHDPAIARSRPGHDNEGARP
ncbi:MAG: iron ABC transporter permease [Alphaproteobacteria bacterium]|jgi:iron(III) transport system permease protein|nr:iron ABC transporter permease [Alphaproteobacteria bacterium]MDP6515453.1 iron ABC transporter permease [Alphaproteobacteria bacterium]